MSREEFEKLKKKNEDRRAVITWTVYGICFFCGLLTLIYLIPGKAIVEAPSAEQFDVPSNVQIISAAKESKFSTVEIATPTPVKKTGFVKRKSFTLIEKYPQQGDWRNDSRLFRSAA